MPKSNYPNGFSDGVLIKEMPLMSVAPGKVYWVGNNATLLDNEATKSDANLGTYNHPFSTIDYAIGKCAANRGDIIYVKANHAETISAAAGIALDVAGVSLIGMGSGENRPILTFATAAGASITTAANIRISNIIMKCNIASQNHMIDVTSDDVTIDNCSFREGNTTGLAFIVADTADNDSDRLRILNCDFYMPTAGNGDAAIQIAKDHDNILIENCIIYGDFDNAAIELPAGGNAQKNMIIRNCHVTNLLTGVHAIEINGTTSTGQIVNCYCVGDTLGTIVDAGGLELMNVWEHDGTDQSAGQLLGTLLDTAENFIGVDDANNVAATTNVVANRDGSILERLEHLVNPNGIGSYLYVTKNLTSSAITQAGVDVTGVSSGGRLELVRLALMTSGVGLAAGTNLTLETNNAAGKLIFATEGVAQLGSAVTWNMDGSTNMFDSGSFLPHIESGKKITAKCTVADCTGAGVLEVHMVFLRLADTATIAAA